MIQNTTSLATSISTVSTSTAGLTVALGALAIGSAIIGLAAYKNHHALAPHLRSWKVLTPSRMSRIIILSLRIIFNRYHKPIEDPLPSIIASKLEDPKDVLNWLIAARAGYQVLNKSATLKEAWSHSGLTYPDEDLTHYLKLNAKPQLTDHEFLQFIFGSHNLERIPLLDDLKQGHDKDYYYLSPYFSLATTHAGMPSFMYQFEKNIRIMSLKHSMIQGICGDRKPFVSLQLSLENGVERIHELFNWKILIHQKEQCLSISSLGSNHSSDPFLELLGSELPGYQFAYYRAHWRETNRVEAKIVDEPGDRLSEKQAQVFRKYLIPLLAGETLNIEHRLITTNFCDDRIEKNLNFTVKLDPSPLLGTEMSE